MNAPLILALLIGGGLVLCALLYALLRLEEHAMRRLCRVSPGAKETDGGRHDTVDGPTLAHPGRG